MRRAEDLGWLGAAASALGMVLVVGLLAKSLADLYPDPSYPFYSGWVPPKNHPEPLEAVRYLLAVAFPLALAAVVVRLGAPGRGERRLEPMVIAAQVGLVVFAGVMAWAERRSGTFDFGRFEPSLLPDANLIAAPLIGLGLTALALRWDSSALAGLRRAAERVDSAPSWIAVALAVLATALWLLPGVITDAGAGAAGLIPVGHIPIEFDEFAAASNGRTPLVDYVPWYGSLTPIALAWWWPLFDLSITSFTTTMVVISGAALLAFYAALRNLTQSAWAALALYVPFVALALQPWDVSGAVREFNGSYFAIMPERYLGPLVVVWLCARHLHRSSPPLWLLFGVAGLAAFNNPEFGIAALAALVAALVAAREGPLGPWLRGAALEAGAGLVGAALFGCLVVLIRSGELPHPELFAYPSRLVRHGYTAAPMSLWGLHWVLYVTYAAALVLAAARIVNRSEDRVLTGLLAFAGVFGLLTGAYFAGRSLPWQLWGLFPAWGMAISLLALASWRGLRAAEAASVRRIVVGAFAALAGFGLMVAAIDRLPAPWQQIDRIGADGEARFDNRAQQRFIEERTEPGEEVLILGWELDHRIAERAGVENVSPFFGVPALLGPRETERAIDQLEKSGGDLVFTRILRPDYTIPSDDLIGAAVDAALRERGYVVVARDPATGTVEWRRSG